VTSALQPPLFEEHSFMSAGHNTAQHTLSDSQHEGAWVVAGGTKALAVRVAEVAGGARATEVRGREVNARRLRRTATVELGALCAHAHANKQNDGSGRE
jgi:hypothetical protein